MMKDARKKVGKHLMVFVLLFTGLTLLLTAAAAIPREWIKDNILTSAELLKERPLFFEVWEGMESSQIDRYGDSVLLNIYYCMEAKDPLRTALYAGYYEDMNRDAGFNLQDMIEQGLEPNQQYLRYWHGTAVVIRPLLIWLHIGQIYLLNGALMLIEIVALMILLWRRGARMQVFWLSAGLLAAQSFFVPLSLEYTPTFIIMPAISIAAVLLWERHKHLLSYLFLIAGMLTGFFDFLTTEIITLLIPLLLIVPVMDMVSKRQTLRRIFLYAGAWGFGYAGMWSGKWLLTSIVLKQNVMKWVTGNITERLWGELAIGPGEQLRLAVIRNIRCLFPFSVTENDGLMLGIIVLAVFALMVLYRREWKECFPSLLLAGIGLVPYIRYLVLSNHSMLHYFFTYRDQAASMMAFGMAVVLAMDKKLLRESAQRIKRGLLRKNS